MAGEGRKTSQGRWEGKEGGDKIYVSGKQKKGQIVCIEAECLKVGRGRGGHSGEE